MIKVRGIAALMISVAALAIAIVALQEARSPVRTPTYADITAAAVSQFTNSGNRMTPGEVLQLFGKPAEVYRDNPKALCWRYAVPYTIKMCWGPKRQQAWISTNIPRRPA